MAGCHELVHCVGGPPPVCFRKEGVAQAPFVLGKQLAEVVHLPILAAHKMDHFVVYDLFEDLIELRAPAAHLVQVGNCSDVVRVEEDCLPVEVAVE